MNCQKSTAIDVEIGSFYQVATWSLGERDLLPDHGKNERFAAQQLLGQLEIIAIDHKVSVRAVSRSAYHHEGEESRPN